MAAIAHETMTHKTLAREAIAAGETSELLSRALGEAVVNIWSCLPLDLQKRLFKEVASHDAGMKPRLAVFLHAKHPRTSAARQARAMLEPDSLGG
jgi:hypothetical protein